VEINSTGYVLLVIKLVKYCLPLSSIKVWEYNAGYRKGFGYSRQVPQSVVCWLIHN